MSCSVIDMSIALTPTPRTSTRGVTQVLAISLRPGIPACPLPFTIRRSPHESSRRWQLAPPGGWSVVFFPEGSTRLAVSFAAPGDHCLCGGHQDLEIECRTEGLDVVNVQVHPFLHGVNSPRDHL